MGLSTGSVPVEYWAKKLKGVRALGFPTGFVPAEPVGWHWGADVGAGGGHVCRMSFALFDTKPLPVCVIKLQGNNKNSKHV